MPAPHPLALILAIAAAAPLLLYNETARAQASFRTLDPFPGGVYSEGFGVSADGRWVVGAAATGGVSEPEHAFRWSAQTGIQDLGDFGTFTGSSVDNGATGLDGWTLISANAVSADGTVIVGSARNAAQQVRAFYALVPAPAPVALLGLGGLALASRRVRS